MAGGFATAAGSGLSAILPNLVHQVWWHAVNAMFQALFQIGQVAGPAVAGLLLAGAGVRFVYWMGRGDHGENAIVATFLMGLQVPSAGTSRRPGLRSIAKPSFSYLRGRPVIQGAYLIDINATVFGMPRAVFPTLALTVFGGGPRTLRVALRRARGRRPARRAHYRLDPPGPAAEPRGHRRRPRVGRGDHLLAWCPPYSRCWPW